MFGDLPRAPHLITGEARSNDEPNSPMCRQSDAKLSSNLSAFKISLFVASPVPCGLPAFHIKLAIACEVSRSSTISLLECLLEYLNYLESTLQADFNGAYP